MSRQKNETDKMWMLFDPAYTLVGQAILESQHIDEIAVFRPVGESAKEALKMHIVLFSKVDDPNVVYRGEVGARRGGKLFLEMITKLEAEARKHLRVCMEFKTKVIYEREGQLYQGPATSIDLSAGGLAFTSPVPLSIGEVCEIVIPITSVMLVMQIEVLRQQEMDDGGYKYAVKFSDISDEEETMLKQAIFGEQWRRGKCSVLSGAR